MSAGSVLYTLGAVIDDCCPNYNLVPGSNACVAWVSVWPSCKGCVPLPSGEGGAERRVRVRECVNLGPHPALRATFSQREKDTPSGFSLICTTLVVDRPYSYVTVSAL